MRPSAVPKTKVLIVDGSAVARQALAALLARERDMEITTAPDPVIALTRLRHVAADVVLCNVSLPRMEALDFIKELRDRSIAVVVCARAEDEERVKALKALESGAVEVFERPCNVGGGFTFSDASRLSSRVRAAARTVGPRSDACRPRSPVLQSSAAMAYRARPGVLIAIGASTGGTEAIRCILEDLPAEAPPLVIVQHMPKGFTGAFAKRLDAGCRVRVSEAKGGEVLVPGIALIAPGDRHLIVRRRSHVLSTELWSGPRIRGHRPSVDVLFESVAEAVGEDSIGVILTGMGADGAEGLLRIHERGGVTMAQDEQSSVVFGMPGSAIKHGGVEIIAGLRRLPGLVLSHGSGQRRSIRSREVTK